MRGGGGEQIKRFVSHSCRSRRLRWLQIKFSYDALTGVDRKTSGRVVVAVVLNERIGRLWSQAMELLMTICDVSCGHANSYFCKRVKLFFLFQSVFNRVFQDTLHAFDGPILSSTTGTDIWSCYCADNTATTGWWPRKSCPLLIPSAWVVAE